MQAFAAGAKLVPGQVEADGKSNGIPRLPELVKLPDVANRLATADTMHAQRGTGAGSQETLRDEVALYLGRILHELPDLGELDEVLHAT